MNEKYEGVRFSTFFIDEVEPEFNDELKLLMHWCSVFDKENLAPTFQNGSAGNLSFRISPDRNAFVITGTSIGIKYRLSADKFVSVWDVDLNKKIVYAEGFREPSSESMLHFAIYKKRPDVQAIFHGHCDEIINAEIYNNITTKNETPYGSIELINEVLKIIEKENFIIIRNHGFISLGSDIDEAGNRVLEELQKVRKNNF